jgi:predicted HD phosphohydrolase
MVRRLRLEDIHRLYGERGGLSYGEGVTQLQHALQCAALAEADAAPPSLILAALLHDIGHLLEVEAERAEDGHHEVTGARALAGLYSQAVRAPIALHVAAKRYLCLKEANHFDALSDASRKSLVLQGGPLAPAEAEAFERRPYWREAVALRRYDDMGKRKDSPDRAFSDFDPLMRSLLIDSPDR